MCVLRELAIYFFVMYLFSIDQKKTLKINKKNRHIENNFNFRGIEYQETLHQKK